MIGKKLGNRYQILDRIGGGGMATVYRALDTVLNRHVSVKILLPQFVTDEDFVRRFRREAQSAASLSHPNVVNVYDVGVENDTYYIVMEYIDGKTLKELIQERAPLAIPEALDVTRQICLALQHAHENNIVHRDIKPHNILIGKDGRVKVTDFGIAQAITSNTITHSGSVLGSVHYFSPEQARGGITDVKSDIYSLGVVLYEMLTGSLPFSGDTPISVALKHLQDHFVEPREINPRIPQSVENIILRALAKDPNERYPSIRDMQRDLDSALQNPNAPKFVVAPIDNTMPTIQIPAVSSLDALTEPAKGNLTPKKKRKTLRYVLWSLLAIFLIIGGIIGGYWLVVNGLRVPDVETPRVTGMSYNEAVRTLVESGFKETNIERVDEAETVDPGKQPVGAGKVFKQTPEAGKTVKANRVITLTVSKGVKSVGMPDLTGLSQSEAQNRLKSMGIQDNQVTIKTDWNANQDKGNIFKTDPAPQVPITPGESNIVLYVSKGIETVKAPNLIKKPYNEAIGLIQDAGLVLGNIVEQSSFTVPRGMVINQTPYAPGTDAPKGDKLDMIVSSGAPQDTKTRNFTVQVKGPQNNEKIVVTIKVTDARGTETVVDNEQIKQDKTYQFDVVLTPNTVGIIEVYQNGKLTDRKEVKY